MPDADRVDERFQRLRTICVGALRIYIEETQKTCALLESIPTDAPISVERWQAALRQRISENEAQERYQIARQHLFEELKPCSKHSESGG